MLMKSKLLLGALVLIGLNGSNGSDAQTDEAARARAALTPKLDHPCPIISASEVSKLFGSAVVDAPATSMPQATTCEFASGDHNAVSITTVPGRYYEEWRGEKFRRLPGIGDKASISFGMFGWRAIARNGSKAAVVITSGSGATQDNAISILKAVLGKTL